ncbi:MAG: MFS transporter [Actinophytocola sp.]|nr:MFS transporter [Actinophytocola sp.]
MCRRRSPPLLTLLCSCSFTSWSGSAWRRCSRPGSPAWPGSADRSAPGRSGTSRGPALAWIVVNPLAGAVTEWLSWRVAHAVPAALAVATLVFGHRLRPGRQQADVPLRTLVADRGARRWIGAELLAYGCWTALLTFVGAFFIEVLAVNAATAGWLLAAGAAAFFAAPTRSGWLVARIVHRRLVAAAAVAMAVLGLALLALRLGVVPAVVLFCLVGLAAGVRTPASSGLALELLPGQAGAMMAIRSAVTQLGYLLGAAVGGALLAAWGYTALGVMVAVGMTLSGLLILRVREPESPSTRR